MRLSKEGREFLVEREGLRLEVYKDVVGLPTIGVGHVLTRSELHSGKIYIDGIAVRYSNGVTREQALSILGEDVRGTENAINRYTKTPYIPLSQNQFDALVSFVFNIGVGAFARSTLLRKLREGFYSEVPGQMKRWIHAGGQVIRGLVRRREKEAGLWGRGG
jgi:lysozyme